MSNTRPIWRTDDELEVLSLPPVTRSQLIEYAGASGDYNPIHTSDEAAKGAGLPGIIAHGMLTAAAMSLPFSPYLEHGYVKDLRVRFSGMVYLDDEVIVGGRVTGDEETADGRLYTFDVYARRGEETVASGRVEFLVFDDWTGRDQLQT